MSDTAMRALLFDFYGDLLTIKQRDCFDLHYNEDLSLAEIAEQQGISRQSVWDMIRRAEQSLVEIETKTGLIARFNERRSILKDVETKLFDLADRLSDVDKKTCLAMIEALAELHD